MTIRILPERAGTLRVEGWLAAKDVDELVRVVTAKPQRVTLDLSELRSADREGIRVLNRLVADGAELFAVPPDIALMLEGSKRPKSTEGDRIATNTETPE